MYIAYIVFGVSLTLALLASARAKLTHDKRIIEGLASVGVPLGLHPFLAACEIAGAAGLLAGLWYAPLGIAAAIGIVLYFIGAVGAHLRTRDFKGLPAPVVFLIFAILSLSLRASSF